MSTVVMGCDPHLDSIAAAVVDRSGTELAAVTVGNDPAGWARLAGLVAEHGIETVGIEGASGWGRRLAETLTAAGVEVREVPTRVTARQRRVDGAGKTDRGDARTIARAAARRDGHRWRDTQDLETIRVIWARRDHLVKAQTADVNQLRAMIAELDPALAARLPRLRSTRQFRQLAGFVIDDPSRYRQTLADLIRTTAHTCADRLDQIRRLGRTLHELMPPAGRELIATFTGCDTITAAQILAQIAGTGGFTSDAQMAAWAGTAPLDASSGRQQRHRLNRGGNRQLNRALHTIILTQLALGTEAAHYIGRRITEGKTRKEAIRAAKRHLTRRIWKTLHRHNLT